MSRGKDIGFIPEASSNADAATTASGPSLPRFVYAIGDIHGRSDLLDIAADAITAHCAEKGAVGNVVFLGDYVDRGPDSKGVVERLMSMTGDPSASVTCLKGNHEDIMIEALETGAEGMWFGNGGMATATSYGWEFPPEHIAWMKALPVMFRDDHRVYVHAGVMPGVPLTEQEPDVCMWIRERFLRADAADLPAHIVHGHTPAHALKPDPAKPELLPHRTNLDTAAFHTGVLTVGVFDADKPGGPVEVLTVTNTQAPEGGAGNGTASNAGASQALRDEHQTATGEKG